MSTVAGFQPPPPSPLESEQSSLVTRGGSSDAQLMRVSIEIARQYPRDERAVMSKLKATIDTYPQLAERMLYSIPYKDRRTDRTVRVEGLSIRAAETLQSAWGNMRTGVRITSEDDDGWNLEAVCFDMEVNVWELAPSRAVKWEKTREGRVQLLDERRQLQARGAAVSKVKRNAILSVLPLHVKAAFEQWIREKLAGGDLSKTADPTRVAACIAAYQTDYKVDLAKLETYVGKPRALWVGADLAELRTLYNGLKDGEATLEDAFPSEPVTTVAPPQGTVVESKDGQLASQHRDPVVPVVVDLIMPEPTPPPITPTVVVPPVPVPPTASTPPPKVAAPANGSDLQALIEACSTVEQCDDLLGKLYKPGAKISREEKRAALLKISAVRDALQRQQG